MVNFNQFLKQAQTMQKKMQELQEDLGSKEYYGKSGGGLVHATINGKGSLQKITLDSSLLKQEEKEILEDLIVAAVNDAKEKSDQDSQGAMSGAFSGLGLPPGMKLPF
jgi:nucleoid-associated protein EbfC